MFVSDAETLFQAICSSPEDDFPRLLFADLLEEQGHPALAARASFIRRQIECEHHPLGSPARLELNRQIGVLRDQFQDEWDRAFTDRNQCFESVTRRRGFVDEVQIAVDQLLSLGEQIFLTAPVRCLRLLDARTREISESAWESLGNQSWLNRVRVLQLGPRSQDLNRTGSLQIDSPPMRLLLTAPGWNRLQCLELPNNHLDDGWLIAFIHRRAESSWFRSVTEYDLSHNDLTDASAYALAATSWPREPVRIKLPGNRFSPEAVAILRRRFGSALGM